MHYQVICPYCSNPAKLVTSKEFYGVDYGTSLYTCTPCDSRVSTHKNSLEPMGSMANSLLRSTRMEAHKLVDPIWKNPFSIHSRSQVYKAISKLMNIPIEDTHIGMFDYGKCHALMFLVKTGAVQRYLYEQNDIKREKRKERKRKEREAFIATNPGKLPTGTTDIPVPQGEKLFGVYSTVSRQYVFGIQEPTKSKAHKALFKRIGKDAFKYRFEVRRLKHYAIEPVKEDIAV